MDSSPQFSLQPSYTLPAAVLTVSTVKGGIKRIMTVLFFCSIILPLSALASNMEKLFYLTPDLPDSAFSCETLNEIKNHAKSINILAPQVYTLDENGILSGTVDEKLLLTAKENNMKVMPLVINPEFNQEQFHYFLNNPLARERAIAGMLSLCKRYHFYGLQFDFENIHINDKQAFTEFFQLTANQLHRNGFAISIAIVPWLPDTSLDEYDRWYFENWSGAFDSKTLGQSADFISIMTYDRHTNLTIPGPVSPANWVEKVIQELLKSVPAKKISLGIPVYSGFWSTVKTDSESAAHSKETQLSYQKTMNLLERFSQSGVWHNQSQSAWCMYSNNYKNEYLFIENAKSFAARLSLAKKYGLSGISVWKLGLEDPGIWRSKNLK